MHRSNPIMQALAQRIIACEAKGAKPSRRGAAPGFPVTGKLRPHLATLMGNAGYRALLMRALALATAEVAWLRAVRVAADGTLEGLVEPDPPVSPEEILKGSVALLAQLLGLCPLLAVSTNLVNAVSLGLATIVVMMLANFAISALRALIPYEIRIPVFVLIIAALVTVVDLAFNAFLHDLYLVLGIFIPLIVTNCIVLARVEAFAAKNGLRAATFDGLMMGIGFVWVIALLGAVRELIGQGTLFSGIEMIFPTLSGIQVLPETYPGFLIAMLPPGAFFVLGLLIAGRNWLDARANQRVRENRQHEQPPAANSLPA